MGVLQRNAIRSEIRRISKSLSDAPKKNRRINGRVYPLFTLYELSRRLGVTTEEVKSMHARGDVSCVGVQVGNSFKLFYLLPSHAIHNRKDR